jgi:hypothetical protein
MKLAIDEIGREILGDDYPYSYDGDIEPEPWKPEEGEEVRERMEERKRRWEQGEWWMTGVRAAAKVRWYDESAPDGHYLIETISTPGLWGVESDAGEEYLDEIYREELTTLRDMLKAMGFSDDDINEHLSKEEVAASA